ncbi:MAG TPA: hypothetical protein VIZ28_04725 [Chitinophagaceae bacterium]
MNIAEVNTPALIKQFLKLPSGIYKNNKYWTLQLGSDIEHVFDPGKNSMFINGNAKRWVVYNEWNMPAGRIAAFYNRAGDVCSGGFGFFECAENYDCTATLLETAFTWLKQQGCKTIEGSVNFGEKDRFWGILTSGFDTPGLYLDNYNHPYYADYFQQFGLQEKDVIYTYKVAIDMIPAKRLDRIAKRLEENEQVLFKPFCFAEIEKYANDMHKVYTHSFEEKNRLKHVSAEDIIQLIKTNKQALEENLIWMAYKNDQPVGLLAFIKDINQSLAISHMRNNNEINLKGFAFSVIPEFRNRGIEFGLFSSLFKTLMINDNKYGLYFSGINAKTTQMHSFMEALNATIFKVHKTFTLNF